jgi:hypothetical protein
MDRLNAASYEEMPCDKCSHGWEYHVLLCGNEKEMFVGNCRVEECHCHGYRVKAKRDPTYEKESRAK